MGGLALESVSSVSRFCHYSATKLFTANCHFAADRSNLHQVFPAWFKTVVVEKFRQPEKYRRKNIHALIEGWFLRRMINGLYELRVRQNSEWGDSEGDFKKRWERKNVVVKSQIIRMAGTKVKRLQWIHGGKMILAGQNPFRVRRSISPSRWIIDKIAVAQSGVDI